MINRVITLNENDKLHKKLVEELSKATDDHLVIVARSYKNRKDNRIKPIDVKNGIYFYVAYKLEGKLAFLSKVTTEQIYRAKANTVRNVVIGDMIDVMLGGGYGIDDWEPSDELMNVVTTVDRADGAGILYCSEFLKAMRDMIGEYYILPSSIHDILFVPKEAGERDALVNLVCEVNATLSDNEFLADDVFEIEDWV